MANNTTTGWVARTLCVRQLRILRPKRNDNCGAFKGSPKGLDAMRAGCVRYPKPQPAGQGRAFGLPSICASLLPVERNRLDRLLENFASFSSPAATPFRNCSSKAESHPANFPRRPRRKQSCRPSALPIRDRSNCRSQEFLPLLRTPFGPGLVNLRPVQLRLWVSSKNHRPSFEKTARLDELVEPPVCRSVFGTLKDQRLFWIAAFFNLTADYADDTDLIPNEP